MRIVMVSVALAAVVASGLTAETQRQTLNVQWRVGLGPSERLIYRGAVCEDGTVYLADSGGRAIAVSANGSVIAERRFPVATLFAASCNRAGDLVVAEGNALAMRLITIPRDATSTARSTDI